MWRCLILMLRYNYRIMPRRLASKTHSFGNIQVHSTAVVLPLRILSLKDTMNGFRGWIKFYIAKIPLITAILTKLINSISINVMNNC
jgi:hypothetical protein